MICREEMERDHPKVMHPEQEKAEAVVEEEWEVIVQDQDREAIVSVLNAGPDLLTSKEHRVTI